MGTISIFGIHSRFLFCRIPGATLINFTSQSSHDFFVIHQGMYSDRLENTTFKYTKSMINIFWKKIRSNDGKIIRRGSILIGCACFFYLEYALISTWYRVPWRNTVLLDDSVFLSHWDKHRDKLLSQSNRKNVTYWGHVDDVKNSILYLQFVPPLRRPVCRHPLCHRSIISCPTLSSCEIR